MGFFSETQAEDEEIIIIRNRFPAAWDTKGDDVPRIYHTPEEFIIERMIFDLAKLFNKDSIYVEKNYTRADYFLWMSFERNQTAYENSKIKR